MYLANEGKVSGEEPGGGARGRSPGEAQVQQPRNTRCYPPILATKGPAGPCFGVSGGLLSGLSLESPIWCAFFQLPWGRTLRLQRNVYTSVKAFRVLDR